MLWKLPFLLDFLVSFLFDFDSKVDTFPGRKNTKKVQPDKMNGEPVFYKLKIFSKKLKDEKFEILTVFQPGEKTVGFLFID